MKRLLIFTALFAPLGLLVFMASDPLGLHKLPHMGLLFSMLGDAYLAALIPAWLSAAMDWALSVKPRYLRLLGTAATGALAVMAELVLLHFGEILTSGVAFLMITLIGAVPAAVCSWLSTLVQPKKALKDQAET
jgi:hypothetical protein